MVSVTHSTTVGSLHCVALLLCWCISAPTTAGEFPVHVVDDSGEAVPSFDVVSIEVVEGRQQTSSYRGKQGRFLIHVFADRPQPSAFTILVRANGYAPAIQAFTGHRAESLLSGKETIHLERGREARLRLRFPSGVVVPSNLQPRIYLREFAHHAHFFRTDRGPNFNTPFLRVKEVGHDSYAFRVPSEPAEIFVAIEHPGWLRYHESGPYDTATLVDEELVVDVPRAASIAVKFDVGAHSAAELPFTVAEISLQRQEANGILDRLAGKTTYYSQASTEFSQLGPGRYHVRVSTLPDEQPLSAEAIDPSLFSDKWVLDIEPGQTFDLRSTYVPFDPRAYRGTHTARIKVRAQDGSPIQGKELNVGYWDGHYGRLNVYKGPVPADGKLELTKLTARAPRYSPFGPYSVAIDDRTIGWFRLDARRDEQEFEFRLAPGAGDMAPDVELTQVESGTKHRLSEFRGKRVLLEFWSTGCGPCQPAMDKLNSIASRQVELAKDRLAIIPISVDKYLASASSHITLSGWDQLNHYWSGGQGGEFRGSPAAKAFGVLGIPTALLIDESGRIVWRGHPMSPAAPVFDTSDAD